jgi:flagellum-specific peptidoglycan hydrolase FlgJ
MAKFKKYPSFEASVADHSAYLTGAKLGDGSLRYEGLVGCKDYRKAATIIKNGGYATAPNYVSVLADVIEKYGLTEFDS